MTEMIVRNIFETPVRLVPSTGGVGDIKYVLLYDRPDFDTPISYMMYTELEPGCSIGYHEHGADEELYVILSGSGLMTVNDETYRVGPGDAILNKPGWSHGLVNDSESVIKLLMIEVEQR